MEFALLSVLVIFTSSVDTSRQKPFRLQMVSQTDDGAYDFAYDTGDGAYHIQSRDNRGTVTGKYAYVDPNGRLREIDYTADRNGFRPQGDIHPQRINRFKTKLSDGNPNPEVNLKSKAFAPTPRLSGLVGQRENSGLGLISEEIIGQAEVEVVVPGQGSISSVTMKSMTEDESSVRQSFPVAPLLSTGNLPIELRDKHPRISLEKNLPSGKEESPGFGLVDGEIFGQEKSSIVDGRSGHFLGSAGVETAQEVAASGVDIVDQRKILNNGQNTGGLGVLGGFNGFPGDDKFLNGPNIPKSAIVDDTKFSVGLNGAEVDGRSEILGDRKFARNIDPYSNGNLFYLPAYQQAVPFAPSISPLSILPLTPAVKVVDVPEGVKQANQFKNEESTLLTEDQGTRLKSLLEKLLKTMTTDNLLLTLENLANFSSTNKDNFHVLENSTLKSTTEHQPQTEELLQILSTLHNFLQKTNLTRTRALTNSDEIIVDPIAPPTTKEDIQEKFPDATIDEPLSPVVGSPLYLPVEGVRNINGEKFLERSYIPLTRRYGYVYTERGE